MIVFLLGTDIPWYKKVFILKILLCVSVLALEIICILVYFLCKRCIKRRKDIETPEASATHGTQNKGSKAEVKIENEEKREEDIVELDKKDVEKEEKKAEHSTDDNNETEEEATAMKQAKKRNKRKWKLALRNLTKKMRKEQKAEHSEVEKNPTAKRKMLGKLKKLWQKV
ncbi:hypothetical protein XENTR_v10008232 [Xenopus tropicalis]|uniref:UPF0329 protein ECU05_1680/ECU11_0050 n=1 Tax=Xenopus tropicalis TaxID=8364 RepID=A0A8J1J803_XENTR|nr:UPF0329 protein ECU05_1680/ECU11_0050 [Xenopus tropicalis]KAE8614593.1 hypothetical protein XENTR_v10008232 [Xenopus tropicalis]|eukprot:XP_012815668.1 PREDICTED: UPF0329 protein ECU05_1680/ECU11_0050-like [Xenopus tropicalis]